MFIIKPCPFFSILFCIFLIIIVKKEKENRCDLKKINYNKVNNNFFLSVPKDCASLICSGVSVQGVSVPGCIHYVPGGKCPRG